MHTDPTIEPLLRSSKLPVYLEELNAFYEEEKIRRERFHEWLTPETNAEFINGQVVMHQPTHNKQPEAIMNLSVLLRTHVKANKLGTVLSGKTLVTLDRNSYQPDISFFGNVKAVTFTNETIHFPAPDFVVEVLSETTEATDRGIKMEDYAQHGVQEYWLVDAEKEIVEQYFLSREAFQLQPRYNKPLISWVIKDFYITAGSIFDKGEYISHLKEILPGEKRLN